jgi:hypothetical protein
MRFADVSLFQFEPLGLGDAYRERRELSAHVAKVLACARIANFANILESPCTDLKMPRRICREPRL